MNALGKVLKSTIVKLEAEEKATVERDRYRLQFHLMPPVGWLNDPNGLCEFQGQYHVFFQYSPFDTHGGLKCWGHYVSKDLIHWSYLGTPLLPDQPYDCHGVYSGSALTEGDEMHLFYTGNVKMNGDHDYITSGRGAATVLASSKDGIHFSHKECVIKDEEYPTDYTCHIRDPKVWKENERYYMVLGGRKMNDKGAVLLYESTDRKQWKLVHEYTKEETFGYMWECPDLFELDGTHVLSISPQGLEREEYRYQNVYQSGYFFMKDDFLNGTLESEFQEWDYGFDFYAPQTFVDSKNRRILIGWIGMPDAEKEYTNPTVNNGWQCALTVPRQITKRGKLLYSYPVEELDALRIERQIYENDTVQILELGGYDFLMQEIQSKEMKLWMNQDICMTYRDGVFTLEFIGRAGAGRSVRKVKVDQLSEVRILIDTSVLEIYLNHGEAVLTTRYYLKDNRILLKTENTVSTNTIWRMKSMTITGEE